MRSALAALLLGALSLQTSALPQSPSADSLQSRNPAAEGAAPDYVHGWCGVHVIQYQKNEGPKGSGGGTLDYRVTVTIKDALQDPIGGVTLLSIPGGVYEGIDSQLPNVFEIEVGGVDSEPVYFKYAAQSWNSNAAQCSVGGNDYDMNDDSTGSNPNGRSGGVDSASGPEIISKETKTNDHIEKDPGQFSKKMKHEPYQKRPKARASKLPKVNK
ncbi:MAG: hypothetical protein ASARMPRED_006059 [Alectoria sarmentosa]|nr:MAG: hypothetical protein ASARMPRED_006059 [Alectoria sarmentosa]